MRTNWLLTETTNHELCVSRNEGRDIFRTRWVRDVPPGIPCGVSRGALVRTWFHSRRFGCSRLRDQGVDTVSGNPRERATMIPAMKVKICVIGEKGFWSLAPNGGFWSRAVFQRSTIRVKFDGKRILGTLVMLERRRPQFLHGGGKWKREECGPSLSLDRISSTICQMSSARESEHIISARETLDSEYILPRSLPGFRLSIHSPVRYLTAPEHQTG